MNAKGKEKVKKNNQLKIKKIGIEKIEKLEKIGREKEREQ